MKLKQQREANVFSKTTKRLITISLGLLIAVLISISILQSQSSKLIAMMMIAYYIGGALTAMFVATLLELWD